LSIGGPAFPSNCINGHTLELDMPADGVKAANLPFTWLMVRGG
jgi:hypothetical protein